MHGCLLCCMAVPRCDPLVVAPVQVVTLLLQHLLDSCGYDCKHRQIRMEQCFFQNLITCLGKAPTLESNEKGQRTVQDYLDLNNKIPLGGSDALTLKKELLKMKHTKMEETTKNLLDPKKLKELKKKCRYAASILFRVFHPLVHLPCHRAHTNS